ncbi:MAG: hypothetical protein GY787_15530 [Alteromonadales bacterium]|nr:hypothetical protein [Alteromonadales bacterium]
MKVIEKKQTKQHSQTLTLHAQPAKQTNKENKAKTKKTKQDSQTLTLHAQPAKQTNKISTKPPFQSQLSLLCEINDYGVQI